MKITSLRIKNLRAFKDETIAFDPYTCLVGPNGAGKSTILCALNIFFRETENSSTNLIQLDPEDFHLRDTASPIEITVIFSELNAEAQGVFRDYYRNGALIVTAKAEYDSESGHAVVRQYGSRLAMAEFAPYFEAAKAKVGAQRLKDIFAGLKERFEGVERATTMDAMAEALRTFEAQHQDLCTPLPSEDQFYGASQGAGRLEKFVQWIYVPAVKDAAEEQAEARNTALGRLLSRTVRAKVNFAERIKALRDEAQERYRELIEAKQEALTEISTALQSRLAQWAHPDATARLTWHQDSKTSVKVEEPTARLITGDGEFEGQIARFGHGMQRSYILALLQGLATMEDASAPTLLLGCEEPELYQHPPQARHLASVLQKLADGNAQIIISTHSPIFVDGSSFENVRMVRKLRTERRSTVRQPTLAGVAAKIAAVSGTTPVWPQGVRAKLHQVLQPALNEMFFTSNLVLVEGLEDAAYINAWLVISDRWDEFRRSGGHVVSVNKKSELMQPIVIAQELGIPTFTIFDADGDKISHQNAARAAELKSQHERDNKAILSLCHGDQDRPFPDEVIWADKFVLWPYDFATTIRKDVGDDIWFRTSTVAAQEFGHTSGMKKNYLQIGSHMQILAQEGLQPPSLERLCDLLLGFGKE